MDDLNSVELENASVLLRAPHEGRAPGHPRRFEDGGGLPDVLECVRSDDPPGPMYLAVQRCHPTEVSGVNMPSRASSVRSLEVEQIASREHRRGRPTGPEQAPAWDNSGDEWKPIRLR